MESTYLHVKRGEREGEESEVGRGGSSSNSVCLCTQNHVDDVFENSLENVVKFIFVKRFELEERRKR